MSRAIDRRQRSDLDTKEWKTLPWRLHQKDSLQMLFDLGFVLAALLEQWDLCENSTVPETSVRRRARLSLDCRALQEELEAWYTTSRSMPEPLSMFTGPSSINGSPLDGETSEAEFTSLLHASCMLYFWLFKMVLNDVLVATEPSEEEENLTFSSLELATNIVSAAPYFLADDTGWLGPQRLFFPLRKAMVVLTSKHSPFVEDAKEAFGRTLGRLRSFAQS